MEKELIEKLKTQLKEKEAKLLGQITELKKPVDMGSDVDSFDEETDEATEYSAHLGMIDSLKKSLERVQDALTKIEAEGYGICEACSSPISEEHLLADPETRLCKDCKLKERK
ncbi:MAG: hypothetical protein COU10_00330 [Candidatus Harrisonbacteria bacterium CG10_big_fil_rev_8_21_14_0_10_45_28]|uniref:Zinc finger DksA/TraR C4-type domain-containing protein n=1 Tax=Candidatus Harrisonbacteria bacterium CG10_big_fil_rev_8_21_14_0_10_45_28 TaxID=1974586 RepID=A0A2H0UR22_9BACT|nr:MAG: hypothetical protein COU10_00330 [Candidatus Harrisonbacteria bacterium CG10_big_fil_rev_8_21_14_0_10_45_28]